MVVGYWYVCSLCMLSMYVYMYVRYVCMYVCIYVCMYDLCMLVVRGGSGGFHVVSVSLQGPIDGFDSHRADVAGIPPNRFSLQEVHWQVCMHVCMYVCMYVCIYMYVYMYVCM